MRTVRLVLACVIAWGLQAGVSFAENDWWDHFSGPGPFRGFFATYRYLCLTNTSDDPGFQRGDKRQVVPKWLSPIDRTGSYLGLASKTPTLEEAMRAENNDRTKAQAVVDCKSDENVRGYLFATYRRAVSIHNDLVTVTTDRSKDRQVHVHGVDFGYVDRVSRSVDLSLAFGYNHFWGEAFDSFNRPSMTPLIEYSPLASAIEGPKAHIVKIMVGGTLWFKQLNAQQFCNRPIAKCVDPTWHAGPEFVPRIGFLFDWSLLR